MAIFTGTEQILQQVHDNPALKKSLAAKLQALEAEHNDHAQAALEQKLAKRYHKASLATPFDDQTILPSICDDGRLPGPSAPWEMASCS